MKPYLRVTLAYAVFGLAWIVFSDQVVARIAANTAMETQIQTSKGAAFVVLSSLLIWTLTRRAWVEHARVEREKLAVFNKTLEGSYHILLNYLNQMQLVTMEAERCGQFDPQVLELARRASDEATAELLKLREVRTVTADNIDAVLYETLRANGAGTTGDLTPKAGG